MELSATIPALLAQQVLAHGPETILRNKDRGIWNAVTWSDLDARAREIGQGFRALGLPPGGVVALLSQTRPHLVYTDLAILGCGAASVAIHPDEDEARVGDVLRETGASVAVVEGEEQLDKVLGVRPSCPALQRIVIIDVKGLRDFQDPHCISLTDLIASGAGQSDWEAATNSVAPDQMAVILVPRSGPLHPMTHADIMRQVDDIGGSLGVHPGDERLAVLPMSDPTERVLGLYLALKYRIVSNYLENPETATENLREVKPTVFGADTEAWERLHDRTNALAAAAASVQKMLYRWAIGTGKSGGPMRTLANFLVLPAVRGQLGFGKLRVAYVGDGAISPEIEQWARGLGITVRYINPFQQGGTHA
jgi:long-chain acyl-CoA synthetase